MKKELTIIAITPVDFFHGEAKKIADILAERKAHYVHLRKPASTISEMEKLIREIPLGFHPQLKLHDHYELTNKYDLGGIHLNSRNKTTNYKLGLLKKNISVSKSFHTLEELENTEGLDYFFISPVFDSISKPGYHAAFDFKILKDKIKGRKAVALGGVTPDKFRQLQSLGFFGAALLGYFFPNNKEN